MAPVVGSGDWPAWIARVPNRSVSEPFFEEVEDMCGKCGVGAGPGVRLRPAESRRSHPCTTTAVRDPGTALTDLRGFGDIRVCRREGGQSILNPESSPIRCPSDFLMI